MAPLDSTSAAFAASAVTPVPTVLFSRDPNTGLARGVDYKFTAHGLVDWRAMVDRKYLFVVKERRDDVVKAQGKPLDECDLSLVDDRWLRIKLAGLTELAHLRGIRSIEFPHFISAEGRATAVCQIEFIGNYETDMLPLIVSSAGGANIRNMDHDFVAYLDTFAENRALVRAIKRGLRINITSDEEIGGDRKGKGLSDDEAQNGHGAASLPSDSSSSTQSQSTSGFTPGATLADFCSSQKKPISFEALRASAIKLYAEAASGTPDVPKLVVDPSTWTGFDSVLPADAWVLMGKIKEKSGGKTKGVKAT